MTFSTTTPFVKSTLLAVASAMDTPLCATSMQHLAKDRAFAKIMHVECYVIAVAQPTTNIHGNKEVVPLLKWIELQPVSVSSILSCVFF